MPSKSEKLSLFYYIGVPFSIGTLFIFAISTIINLLDASVLGPAILSNSFSSSNNLNKSISTINDISKETKNRNLDNVTVKKSLKIIIGTVVCHNSSDLSPREEALLLLESTIISAILYETFPINIEFHIFLEHWKDRKYFSQNTWHFSELPYAIQVDIEFHSVFDIVPKEYQSLLFTSNIRCEYVPIFFPSGLPKVDSILYLDTDSITTGNLAEIWDNFYKMGNIQLVGAVMDIKPDNQPWLQEYQDSFLDIPIPTKQGLNAGVLLMNLTKMRMYQFEDKIMKLYKDYWITLNFQSLLNTLLFYNTYLLYLLPCQYNFRPSTCTRGFYCSDVLKDPTGIQIIHLSNMYKNSNMEKAFEDIAVAYKGITKRTADLRTNLVIKIRDMYKMDSKGDDEHGKCNGVLNNFLFKRFFQ